MGFSCRLQSQRRGWRYLRPVTNLRQRLRATRLVAPHAKRSRPDLPDLPNRPSAPRRSASGTSPRRTVAESAQSLSGQPAAPSWRRFKSAACAQILGFGEGATQLTYARTIFAPAKAAGIVLAAHGQPLSGEAFMSMIPDPDKNLDGWHKVAGFIATVSQPRGLGKRHPAGHA
jgi:hypothetical protein